MVPARTAFLVIALALTGAASAWAVPQSRRIPAQPSAARAAAWDRLRASAVGPDASVEWSAVDDVPISLRAGSGASPFPGWRRDRTAAVLGFVSEHADLFRLRPGIDAFQVVGAREHNGVHHQRIVQTWRGIPVRGGQYMVSVGVDGRLRMMGGRSVPEVETDGTPALTRAQAITAAAASRGRAPGRDSVTCRLAIEPRDGRDLIVWEVRLQSRTRPEAWEILVDARDGTIAGSRDLGFGASGCAAVWNPNPNHPLRDEDFEIAAPVAGVARIEGSQVRVTHETAAEATSSVVLDPQGCFDFRFDPVAQLDAFEQANVYWHMDHFLREFHGGNGFVGMPQPITVFVRAFQCGDPNTGQTIGNSIWLTGEGCGYKASTREADIIDHETQHAVNNAFGLDGGTDRSREIYATALHEGLANYFACAANDDPIYAEYFFGPQGFANCNSSPSEYNYQRIDEIGVGNLGNYLIGMIWSGALWDIRTAIGPIIDRIALESLDYLPATPTMFEAKDAVLQADFDHHGGAHLTALQAAFEARGIPARSPAPGFMGPQERFKNEPGVWIASATHGTPPYMFAWSRLRQGSSVLEPVGSGPSVTLADTASFDLVLTVFDGLEQRADTTVHVSVVPLVMSAVIFGPSRVLPDSLTGWSASVQAPRYVPASYRWTWGCTRDACTPNIRDGTVLSTRLTESSRLQLTATAYGVSTTLEKDVEVDVMPEVTILDAPTSLAPGEVARVRSQVVGGIGPLAYVWMRNCRELSCRISRDPTVEVIGDNIETELHLQVITALGLKSNLATIAIAPRGVPLDAAIDGPEIVSQESPGQWIARINGGLPPSPSYRWTVTCLDPGCAPAEVGNQQWLLYSLDQDFDLGLTVATSTRTASVKRRIRMQGVPIATLVEAPDWVAPSERVTFRAEASGGAEPYTYRWTRNGLTDVIGTGSTLSWSGDGTDFELFLTVRAATGLRSALVQHTVHAGFDGRPVPDRAALRIDRAVVQEGADLAITLEGRPGSAADLRLLDIAGREVARLFDDTLPMGVQVLRWNSGQVHSGVYLLNAVIGDERITRRVNVVR
jgi:hypothetical protein